MRSESTRKQERATRNESTKDRERSSEQGGDLESIAGKWQERCAQALDPKPVIEAASAESVDDITSGDAEWRLLFFGDGSLLQVTRQDRKMQFVELERGCGA